MGIYDREYYREQSRGAGLFSGIAPACKALILINVGVFLVRWFSPEASFFLDKWFALHSESLFHQGTLWQLVTSAFLHSRSDVFHILFNLVTLWLVGTEMEVMYGRREFLAMYLSAAVFSGLCWATFNQFASDGGGTLLGASGAIMALVVLYALWYPRRTILIYGLIPVEMWLLATIYIVGDLFRLYSVTTRGDDTDHSRVAFAAHLGGAAYGYLYKRFDLRWTRLLTRPPRRPRLRVVSAEPREHVAPAPVPPGVQARTSAPTPDIPRATPPGPSFPEEQLNARLDEVLAKIVSQGRETLTDEEHRILQEASRRARSRRDESAR